MPPPWDQTGVPGLVAFAHFHSSTTSGSAALMISSHLAERRAAPIAQLLDLLVDQLGSIRRVTCHVHPFSSEWQTPWASDSRGLPREPVRVGEGPGIAADHEPVRSGAVRGDAGVLGEGTAPVERQLDAGSTVWRTRRTCGRSSSPRRGRGRRRTACSRQRPRLPAGARSRRSAGWPGRCPSSPRSRPSRSSRPEHGRRRRSPTDDFSAGFSGVAPASRAASIRRVDGGRLRHHERQREPAEAGRRCLRGPHADLRVQTEGGGVEARRRPWGRALRG